MASREWDVWVKHNKRKKAISRNTYLQNTYYHSENSNQVFTQRWKLKTKMHPKCRFFLNSVLIAKNKKTKQKTQETKMKCWLHFPTSFKIVWLSRRKPLSHQYNEYKICWPRGSPLIFVLNVNIWNGWLFTCTKES